MHRQLLGSDHDDALFARLCEAVWRLGGSIEDREWVLGGAREATTFEIKLPDGRLEAILDTDIGLLLSGPEELVVRVAEAAQMTPPFDVFWGGRLDRLSVGLDAWVIQDGNYGDFTVGDDATFALEFWAADLRPSRSNQAVALHRGRGGYDVCAQVAFLESNVWVLDFGVFAYSESKPPEWARRGSWVEGRIDLGIDPFFYKEYLRKLPGMPRLFHDWTIASILRNDTPWLVDSVDTGGKVLARDQANETWTSVVATDAWNDDEGRSSYILEVHRRAVER